MNKPTKTLILANFADEFGNDAARVVACAVLPVTAELVALCRQRIEVAEAAYARVPSLAELCFRDAQGPQIFGEELLEACGHYSNAFHDDFVNNHSAVLPKGVGLDEFRATRAECQRTVIWPNTPSPAGWNIAWSALPVDTEAGIRTAAVPAEYLEQLLASDQPAGCDCEAPGYYCSGVPGILAHLSSGRLAAGAIVERCESCDRFSSDTAALDELRRRGVA